MSKMATYFTRSAANEGAELKLSDPRTGLLTGEWLRIVGADSDRFRHAQDEMVRKGVELASMEDGELKDKARKDIELELLCSAVVGWSFDEECTPELVKTLLTEAPQIRDAIDRAVMLRARFFALASSSSLNTPQASSTSSSS